MVTQVPAANTSYEISDDNGLNWFILVCLQTRTTNFEASTTEESTINCGVLVDQGDSKASTDFDAVSNVTPGAGEVSFKKALDWHINSTPLKVRSIQGVSGTDWFYAFDAKISAISEAVEANGMHKFSGTILSTGLIDIVYP